MEYDRNNVQWGKSEVDGFWKTVLRQQFGAAIDMLENAIRACPDDVWCDYTKKPEWVENDIVGFWYVAYHTLFFLDFYLSDSIEDFGPPAPFNRDEFDSAGLLPERPYSKESLLSYLDHGRRKCYSAIDAISEEKACQPSGLRPELNLYVAELLLYNLRHVQHHAAQLNLILRQKIGTAPGWVTTSRKSR
jgi:DinB superfamily